MSSPFPLPMPPTESDIGAKVSIRLVEGTGYRDLLGALEQVNVVRKKDGSLHSFDPADISAWKIVHPTSDRAGTGAPLTLRINQLEKILEESWPATTQYSRCGWRYRISSGFTYRANSIIPSGKLPFGEPELSLHEELNFAIAHYRKVGLVPAFHVPLPSYQSLDDELEAQGWNKVIDAQVMIADTPDIPSRALPAEFKVVESNEISERWLDVQNIHEGRSIMESFPARYLAIEYRGNWIASARVALNQGWTILSRIFIQDEFRGRGLSRPFLTEMVRNSSKVALQVDTSNATALHLYATSGFRLHHSYRYRTFTE